MIQVDIKFLSQQKGQPPERILHSFFISNRGEQWGGYVRFQCWVNHDPRRYTHPDLPHVEIMHRPEDGPTELVLRCLQKLKEELGTLRDVNIETI